MNRFMFLGMFVGAWAFGGVQSTFTGPASLKVWQHWQQSWNVEDVTAGEWKFKLTRGMDGPTPFVSLEYKSSDKELKATVQCRYRERTDVWQNQIAEGKEKQVQSRSGGDVATFEFKNFADCVDQNEKRIVESIKFKIEKGDKTIYEYSLTPMYVRGKNQVYWDNPIAAYSAHAGSGKIRVATAMSAEAKWDKWQGILVKPVLEFVDRNTMEAEAFIGLHRHEAHQEAYFIESGEAVMLSGVSARSGENYKTLRQWDEKGATQETTQFDAEGGWVESRNLSSGEVSVVVPNPENKDAVYFHGIRAVKDTVFWTMGSKN
ncbi:MAG: hypothetical protein R3B54_01650 [Bdellovibrionota bacterium]